MSPALGGCTRHQLTPPSEARNDRAALMACGFQLAFWCALVMLVYVGVARPMPGGPDGVLSTFDKLTHVSVYASLALLGLLARQSHMSVLVVLSLHGISIEVLQAFSPHRVGDWRDFAANSLGVLVVLLVARIKKP